MKKFIVLAIISLTAFSATINAQQKGDFKIGVGPDFILPVGKSGDIYKLGIGGGVQGAYGISEHVAAFAQAGSSFYRYKTLKENKSDLKYKKSTNCMASMVAGIRYHNEGFMIGMGIGYANFNDNGDIPGGFAYTPQIGYEYRNFDFILSFTGATAKGKLSGSNFSSIGLKVLYNFTWCKNSSPAPLKDAAIANMKN